ncbi:hypothetical protein IHE55_06810 [Streptomyces pactum]|uniref:Translation initiation factor IF-2 n=1 Tax=Streptomyces pactum TaxID=68249 RepID=A0ABS0NH57_9ACTN|nr:DUF6153 family protein [Streptomyces pactum]MBH5334526.1 hypothetical protein [Streptomyces pactum]
MTTRTRTRRPLRARACLLLVWSLLAGIVAMHGLGTGAFAAAAQSARQAPPHGAPAAGHGPGPHPVAAGPAPAHAGEVSGAPAYRDGAPGDAHRAAYDDRRATAYERRPAAGPRTGSASAGPATGTGERSPVTRPRLPDGSGHALPAYDRRPTTAGAPGGPACHDLGGGEGHPHHADATCAAPGISTAPVPPPLPAGAVVPDADPAGLRPPAPSDRTGPDPPSLSRLQLLRI